jgi:hypothetical protein
MESDKKIGIASSKILLFYEICNTICCASPINPITLEEDIGYKEIDMDN